MLVFVYGSLLSKTESFERAPSLHSVLRGHIPWSKQPLEAATFQGVGTVPEGQFTMRDLGMYPAVIEAGPEDESSPIRGELYKVGPELLEALDFIEAGYTRIEVEVHVAGGLERKQAQMYLGPRKQLVTRPPVPGGDWIVHLARHFRLRR